jgi:hypothetical protein
MVDSIEATLDVGIEHKFGFVADTEEDCLDCIMG